MKLALDIGLVITSLLMVVLVLLHRGKGGGLSSLFGGGVQSSLSGSSVRSISEPPSVRSSNFTESSKKASFERQVP